MIPNSILYKKKLNYNIYIILTYNIDFLDVFFTIFVE